MRATPQSGVRHPLRWGSYALCCHLRLCKLVWRAEMHQLNAAMNRILAVLWQQHWHYAHHPYSGKGGTPNVISNTAANSASRKQE